MIVKRYSLLFYESLVIFFQQRGMTLAAASTFYAVLTIVPLLLLLVRIVGWFMGDISETENHLFSLVRESFPDIAPGMILKIKSMIKGPLYGGVQFTFLNLTILTWSSLSFFNSIWNGLYLMTGDRSHLSFFKHFKGLLIIAVTICVVVLSISVPAILHFISELMKHNFITDFLLKYVPSSKPMVHYFTMNAFGMAYILKSNIINALLFIFYFAFLYRWFFSWRLNFYQSLAGSLVFVISLLAAKNLFWIYMKYVRDGLVRNYGDYYTFILAIIWIFFVMGLFFFAASICHVLMENNALQFKKKVNQS